MILNLAGRSKERRGAKFSPEFHPRHVVRFRGPALLVGLETYGDFSNEVVAVSRLPTAPRRFRFRPMRGWLLRSSGRRRCSWHCSRRGRSGASRPESAGNPRGKAGGLASISTVQVDIVELNHVVKHTQDWQNPNRIEVFIDSSCWLYWRLDPDGEYRVHEWSAYEDTQVLESRDGKVKVRVGKVEISGRMFRETYTTWDVWDLSKKNWPHEHWPRKRIPGLR